MESAVTEGDGHKYTRQRDNEVPLQAPKRKPPLEGGGYRGGGIEAITSSHLDAQVRPEIQSAVF